MLPILSLLSIAASQALSSPSYLNPACGGGSTTFHFKDAPQNVEPLNVIVDMPAIPGMNATAAITSWLASIHLSDECLGLHLSGVAIANLGDSRGDRPLAFLYRENFGDLNAGTCRQTVVGGLHLRAWRQYQSTSDSDTESQPAVWLFGASTEESLELKHTISPNGYDSGRDEIIRRAQTPRTYNASDVPWPAVSTVTILQGLQPLSLFNHNICSDGAVVLLQIPPPYA
jgi:hypothetical protein